MVSKVNGVTRKFITVISCSLMEMSVYGNCSPNAGIATVVPISNRHGF